MTIIRKWTGNGLSAGVIQPGTGDDSFSGTVGTPTVVAGGPRSPRIQVVDTATPCNVRWWPLPAAPLTQYSFRCYYSMSGHNATERGVVRGNLSGAEVWSVRITSSGLLRLRNSAGTLSTGVVILPTDGTSVRVEGKVEAGILNVFAYDGDTNNVLDQLNLTVASGIDETWFGKFSSVASTGYTLDDLAVSDQVTLIGSVDPPDTTESIYWRWDGADWVPMTMERL